ncbi:amino acid adenylation domain-containing protein [Kitasatospora sp. NPDC101447]|uniref:hybrid non-ribosomal peptide synthetase/type I polyketide synthase n=1 Tax=Kitasatospora sp. NPDC101447 TaxID=3364102 RepID=UPI003810BD02
MTDETMTDENDLPDNAIAVIGMAVRVPGARTLEGFWQNLRDGVESIATFTDEELLAAGATPEEIARPGYVRARGALDGVEGFDARLFGFSPREAQLLDPQHRLFLECAWEALEHAGRPSEATDAVTGVFAGVGESSYLVNNLLRRQDLVARIGEFQTSLGNDKDFAPTRVSYKLDLRGPSVSVQTGCSTSLVAVHTACQALINGECDVALAGGATVTAAQRRGYQYEEGGVLSRDGHCRAFDADASGTVPASGSGVVVLKRLEDAVADGDAIHAVIRGSAINNDGARKAGFTAPSVEGQADVIAEALGVADVDPSTVTYVEAHGTGTPIGDPIEVAALKAIFGDAPQRVALGSVKTNLGHLDTAAGVVGLIKTVLALTARELPPSLHFSRANPQLGLEEGPFHVNAALVPWSGRVLRAGVSSFGIGGTNAHVVLEEAPARVSTVGGRRLHVLPLSAATATALRATGTQLAAHLRARPEEGGGLADVAYTLQRGRWTLEHRGFVVAGGTEEAADALALPAFDRSATQETAKDREVVFLFSGQGAQRIRMGQALYENEPVFRTEVDLAADVLAPVLKEDVRRLLYPGATEAEPTETIHQTRFAQPALFVLEYALARLWMSWGVRPAAMLGHSLGELVAACLAGVMSPEDALSLVATRGRLMQDAAAGAMVAVPLPENEVASLLDGELDLAAVNGPRACVVSGPFDAVVRFEARMAGQGVATKRLRTSHAFHSRMMEAAAAAFEAEVAQVRLSAPQIPFVSSVTGVWITDEEAVSPAYWAQQIRATVRFADGLHTVRRPGTLLLEVGPGQSLVRLAGAGEDGRGAVASLPSNGPDCDAEAELLAAVGEVWCRGASVDWEALHGAEVPRRTVLPTYPFEHERCWVDAPNGTAAAPVVPGALLARGFRRLGPVGVLRGEEARGAWLVAADRTDTVDAVVDRLRAHGKTVVTAASAAAGADVLASKVEAGVPVEGVLVGMLDAQTLAPASLSAWEQALTERGDADARIVAVTSGALDVTGEEPLVPTRGTLAAWAQGGRRRTLVDVTVSGTAAAARRLATALLGELCGAAHAPVVALRGGHRFAPVLEPLPDAPREPNERHRGAHFTLWGDEPQTAPFGRALTRVGASVRTGPTAGTDLAGPATAVVVLAADAAEDDALALLGNVASAVAHGHRAVEVHLVGRTGTEVGEPQLAGVVEAFLALAARECETPWTSYTWLVGDPASVERRAARVVGAVSGCQVVVTPEDEPAQSLPSGGEDVADGEPAYEDETEREVAVIFEDLLGVRHIAPTTGFFELGGHSLLAAQFATQMREVCGVELPLSTLFTDPTIRGIAAALRAARVRPDAAVELWPTVVPDPAAAAEPFPLTDVQQAYFVGRTGVFELGNVGMHGYEEFDVPDLDVPRMERAFRRLIRRHGMLRVIVLPQGEQQILDDVPDYAIATEDVRGLTEEAAREVLERTRQELSHQVFVPDCWPLFDLRATVMDGGRGRVHYSVDGLITDAWAYGLLMRELVELYTNPDAELPELELTFRDYVLAEHSLESGERFRRAEAYWQERIPELALAPELPLARDPRTIDTPRFHRTGGELPQESWARVKASASRRGLTPTALLLTAYSEVLATWSKNSRFTLNLPMANRLPLHPQVEEIIGDFTSVTLLEIDALSEAPFETRAVAVRDRLVADLDHRLFSGLRVMREMKKARGDAAAAMPVVFTSLFVNHGDDDQLGEVVYSISQTPQVWIDAQVYEAAGALVLDIDAVEGLFPEGMVAAMHAATLDLLEWLALDDDNWGRPVPSLVPRTDLAAWEEYNRTDGLLPSGLLHEPFFAIAARTPERPAVITPSRTLSYGELAAHACGIAARLGVVGVVPNDLVAVVMEKGWEQCAAVLGILAAGAAYLPIDPELPDERIRLLLDHGHVRSVLTQSRVAEDGADRFAGVDTVLQVDRLDLASDAEAAAAPSGAIRTKPEDLAYVIFTSGSTGLPKGVMINHRGALNTVVDINERFGVGEDDRVLALSSLSFDLSVYDVFGPLAVGGAVVVPDARAHRDPAAWLALMGEAGVTVWNSVPALMELLVEHMSVKGLTGAGTNGGGLKLVMLSGDWLPVTLPDRIRQLFAAPEVVSLGGATEASIWSILYPIGEVPEHWASIPYGRPMRNQTFHVLDEALRPRPIGVPGQLYIGGVGLADGYLRDETKTKASFITDPVTGDRLYRTGDLGRFLPSRDIEFLGREDFQVKVQGYRIELGEIEAALMQHPDIRAAVAVVDGDPRGTKRLVAFVVPQTGGAMPQDIREFLGEKLPAYMVPTVFLEIDALPLTANGKVDRRALVVPENAADETAPPYEAPGTPVEEAIAEVWSSMLNVERVGIHDNFFLLGGDSLMAMRAVVHLRKALDLDIPIRVLFDSETLGETALLIEDLLIAEIEGISDEEAQSLLADD